MQSCCCKKSWTRIIVWNSERCFKAFWNFVSVKYAPRKMVIRRAFFYVYDFLLLNFAGIKQWKCQRWVRINTYMYMHLYYIHMCICIYIYNIHMYTILGLELRASCLLERHSAP
jgi:hypothetical protein